MGKEYINRGAVLAKLRMYEEHECKPVEAALAAVEDVRKLIAEMPSEEAKPDALVGRWIPVRWIPVTEGLPEAKVDVLVVMHYMNGRTAVNQGWYSVLNEQWYVGVAGIHAPVTHWMPLPEPPKEETE